MPFEGIVSVLKPPGMTSSDVVVDVRRIFGEKRVGHTGTLDPAAAGVLPICIGRATRLFDYLVDKRKEYLAELRFGLSTDTGDAYGNINARSERIVSRDELESALPKFIGEITQIPPIYSSLSVNGVKMYKLARRGEVTEPVKERERRINIYSLECVSELRTNGFLIRINCSKGTYIRTLCMDIGRELGVPAYMPFLLRTASGKFAVEASHTIAELKQLADEDKLCSVVMPMDEAVDNIPELRLGGLSARNRRLLINGASIACREDMLPEGEVRRIYMDGDFLGLGVRGEEGLHITVWLGREELLNDGKRH